MRRLVKENLLTFDGKPLFPERVATRSTTTFRPDERRLYEAVTDYVRDGMNRAERLREGERPPRDRRRLRAHRPAAPAGVVAGGDLPVARAPPRATGAPSKRPRSAWASGSPKPV